jgi:hypothetical protein
MGADVSRRFAESIPECNAIRVKITEEFTQPEGSLIPAATEVNDFLPSFVLDTCAWIKFSLSYEGQ